MTQTALITGANRGIGLELAKQLKARGTSIIASVRRSTPELEALGVRILDGIDVSTTQGLATLKEALGSVSVDLLINNAGILRSTSLDNLDSAAIREQFEVNALAPLLLTQTLLPHLSKGAKVALITSRMGSMADNSSGGHYGYRMSKAALNAAGKSLAVDLAPKGIAVGLLHPGWVKTEMTGNTGNVTAAEAATQLLARIDGLNLDNTGTFFHANGEVLPF